MKLLDLFSVCVAKLCKEKMNNTQFYLAILCIVAASLINGDSLPTELFKGDITYYKEWRGNYGSCALNKSFSDPYQVAALSRHWMKLPQNITNPNNHPLCGEQHCVKINGKRSSVVLKISDTCYGCRPYDLDIADKIYPLLDDPRKGRIKMTWRFIDCKFMEN